MKAVFLETANVTAFREAVRQMEDVERGQPGIFLAWGQAGRGKTFAVRNYHSLHGGIYLSVWQEWTQAAFLSALCFEVCGKRPRGANACKLEIVAALNREVRSIFVDEADRLQVQRIEDLRDIHEATGAPIVLVGEEELLGLLSNRRRVWSRVVQEQQFEAITVDDITLFALDAAGLSVLPDAATKMRQASDGDFRLVRNMVLHLEQAARVRDTDEVDLGLLQTVLAQRSWRRS